MNEDVKDALRLADFVTCISGRAATMCLESDNYRTAMSKTLSLGMRENERWNQEENVYLTVLRGLIIPGAANLARGMQVNGDPHTANSLFEAIFRFLSASGSIHHMPGLKRPSQSPDEGVR